MENIKDEIWVTIKGLENIYLSNRGMVKTIKNGVDFFYTIHKGKAAIRYNKKNLSINIGQELHKHFASDIIDSVHYPRVHDWEGEKWIPITTKNVPDGYLISNFFRIKRMPHIVNTPMGNEYFLGESLVSASINNMGYYQVGFGRVKKLLHRIIAEHFISNQGNLKIVNHKDANKLNNNLSNLEFVSHRENISHGKTNINRTSKYIGVHFSKGRWKCSIDIDGAKKYLGSHDTEELAHQAYLQALKEHGITNKYAQPIPEKRQLWKRPYYEKSSPNYLNRDAR